MFELSGRGAGGTGLIYQPGKCEPSKQCTDKNNRGTDAMRNFQGKPGAQRPYYFRFHMALLMRALTIWARTVVKNLAYCAAVSFPWRARFYDLKGDSIANTFLC
jgi:hypothetical protein